MTGIYGLSSDTAECVTDYIFAHTQTMLAEQASHLEELRRENEELKQSVAINGGVASVGIDMLIEKNNEINRLKSTLASVRDSMESIIEYWNGAENSMAMSDALDHNIEEATKALAILNDAGKEIV
jgi:hypothetical protein